jgi:hypothetical protein
MTNNLNKIYFTYLDELRGSGETNLYFPEAFLVEKFGIDKREAMSITSAWMTWVSNGRQIDEVVS